jgi:D-hexose-6-phosphate mutarotase
MTSPLVRVTLPPTVALDSGEGGLPRLTVRNAQARAQIYLHGAHVTAWQPENQAGVLWMSRKSHWDAAKPIRGGIPICFPWFGPHATDPSAPSHGIARLRDWALVEAHDDDRGATVLVFLLKQNAFSATYRVTVGTSLGLALEVHNPGAGIFTFEAALHTYFAVRDVRSVEIRGLEGTEYLDKVGEATRRRQGSSPITFTGETDRIYLNTQAACTIHDPELRRRIVVQKTGSDATVVWNPWIAKAAAMPDFRDDEWPEMVCVETGNVNVHAVTLAPGATHTLTAAIELRPA